MNCKIVQENLYEYSKKRLLNDRQYKQIESHIKSCSPCQKAFFEIKETIALLDLWKPPKPRANFTDMVLKKVGLERQYSHFLLAADPDYNVGQTLGVAIDQVYGQECFLITITARVDKETNEDQETNISVNILRGTDSSKLFSKRIYERYSSFPCLKHLNLNKRKVYIEIDSPHKIEKLESLTLATIMAVVKAATKTICLDNIVFSADVDLNGQLLPVGSFQEKAQFVLSSNDYQLIASDKNDMEGIHEKIKTFKTLADLVAWAMDYEENKKNTDVSLSMLKIFIACFTISGCLFLMYQLFMLWSK